MTSPYKEASAYLELCKMKIALFTSFSAITGFIVARRLFEAQVIIIAIGIFFLACGSSALNQYLERDTDSKMPRTMNRPIPSGRIAPFPALIFSLIFISQGLFALLLSGILAAPLMGAFAVIWYNCLYTFLKRKSAFAVIPGALVGAVPVAIGWISGGGGLYDPRLLILSFFFFMWQVPHSWLFILKYGEEYEQAGLPSLTATFSRGQLARINFIWISATAVSCLLIAAGGTTRIFSINMLLVALSAWLVWNGARLLQRNKLRSAYSLAFRNINVYMFSIMILLSTDNFF